jgi:hypothetical protein
MGQRFLDWADCCDQTLIQPHPTASVSLGGDGNQAQQEGTHLLWLLCFKAELPVYPSCLCCQAGLVVLEGLVLALGREEPTWAAFPC